MAHTAAWRRSASGDKARHWLFTALLGFVDQELRGFFFCAAADFTDHDDRLGGIVGQEQFKAINEVGAIDRVAANADRRGLAKAFGCCLEHGFIGQCARTRHNAHRSCRENAAGHDTDFAFAWRQYTGAVWTDQARF